MEAMLKEKSKEKEKLESLPLGEDRGKFSWFNIFKYINKSISVMDRNERLFQ